jgi:hypothetical protein
MSQPRVLLGFTYSMAALAHTARSSGVTLVMPRSAHLVGAEFGLDVVDLPPLSHLSRTEGDTAFDKVIDENNIDAVWPLAMSSYDLSGITAAPVHTVCKHKTYNMVNDKVTFNSWVRNSMFQPEGVETVGADRTMEEIRGRLADGQRVCCKPPRGVNGGGFWEIDPNANLLADPLARKVTPEVFELEIRRLEEQEGMERFLVMEVLPGQELSIDVLCVNGELLKWMIREKVSENTQIIRSNHKIIEHVRHLVKALRLHGLVSVQYMYDRHGNIKILEINLRPSGGCLSYGEFILRETVGSSDLLTDWLQYMTGIIEPDDIKPWHGDWRMDKVQWGGMKRLDIKPIASLD